MIKINSGLQTEIPGMESWRLQYSEKKLRLLEKSWAGIFRDFVLHELPVKKMITHLYHRKKISLFFCSEVFF